MGKTVGAEKVSVVPGITSRLVLALRLIVPVLLGTFSLPGAGQENSSEEWLQYMSAALRSLDYQGSFVYERNGEISALRLFHEGGGRERERLVGLNGPRNEVLREGDLISCSQQDGQIALFPNRDGFRLLPLIPGTRGQAFSVSYAASMGNEDRVAGYRARIIEIAPKDGYRYGYRVWLEEDTKLPLRSAMVDAGRRTLEQFMFVTLDLHDKTKASDLVGTSAAAVAGAPEELPLTTPPRWQVADPPPGFSYLYGQRPALAPTQAEHYLYSDGIANVSVYVEPRDQRQPPAPDGALTRGALNVYVRSDGEWKITVLGDVPRATVQRMARSVRPAESARD